MFLVKFQISDSFLNKFKDQKWGKCVVDPNNETMHLQTRKAFVFNSTTIATQS